MRYVYIRDDKGKMLILRPLDTTEGGECSRAVMATCDSPKHAQSICEALNDYEPLKPAERPKPENAA